MIDDAKCVMPLVTWAGGPDWDEVSTLCGGWLTYDGIERLKPALDGRVKTVAVERHYIDKDYRDTFSNYHSKRFSTPPSRCIRLHFFSSVHSRTDLRSRDTVQPSYLGYSIIRPTRPNCIGRTLIVPDEKHLCGAHVSKCEEETCIQGTILKVKGFPFISQDTDVTVCAQSALWMVMRYFSDRYSVYKEIHPVEIGNLTRDYSIGRVFPTAGLYTWQLAEAFRRVGFSPLIYERQIIGSDFEHLLYTYIESGIPTLIAFSDHVVAGCGHRSDFSLAAPPMPKPLYSSDFNTAFVIHDDNEYPAQLLARTSAGAAGESKYSFKDIESFVVPLPERVFLPAECFQRAVIELLDKSPFAYAKHSPLLSSRRLLSRTFLTTGRSFKRRLLARGMGHADAEGIYRNLPLPHFIWVCELSNEDLYLKDRKVLGEVIWDATRNANEPDGWIALHYPEKLFVDTGAVFNGSHDIREFDLKAGGAYGVYVSNLEEIQ